MGKRQKSKSVNVNIPVNLPQPPATILSGPSLEAREKQLSFRDGLLKKRRQDPTAFVREDDHKQQQQHSQLYSPMVLHCNPEECLKRTREPPSDRSRVMMNRATILMVHWLARADARTLSSCTLFGVGDFATLMTSNGQHRHLKQSSRYSSGWRLYSILQRLKMDYYGQTISGNPQAKLAEFWYSLDNKSKEQVLRQELAARLPTFRPTWCVCNCCKHRRICMTDVLDQLLRAYCEDLDSAIRQLSTNTSEPLSLCEHEKSRRQLFKSVSLVTASGVAARKRPIFDVLAAFTGLCFTDHQGGEDDSEDEGVIEYPDDEEDDDEGVINQWCDDEECCSCDRRHEEDDLDDMLDYSDDDEVMAAMEGELGVDEGELMGPIASFSRRPSKHPQYKAVLSVDDSDALENALIADGKSVYQLFAADLLLHRLILTYMEAETRRKQMELFQEEEEAAKRAAERKEKKAAKRSMKRRKAEDSVAAIASPSIPAVVPSEDDTVKDNSDGTVNESITINTDTITTITDTITDTEPNTAIPETFIDTLPDHADHGDHAENDGNTANTANTVIAPDDDFDFATIDKAIRDRLSLSTDTTDNLAPPPGLDTMMPPGFDSNGPAINYNYWTSSVFGPSLFQPFL